MNVKEKERFRVFLEDLAQVLEKHHATLLAVMDYEIPIVEVEFDGPTTACELGGLIDQYVQTNWVVKKQLEG